MVSERVDEALWPSESITVKVGLALLVLPGVPLARPVALSMIPAGRLPAVTLQVYGGAPPLAASWATYAVPTYPLGSEVVVTVNVPTPITRVSGAVAVWGVEAESIAWTVNMLVPAAVGVP